MEELHFKVKNALLKIDFFYKITEEQAGAFTFGFHIILRDGMADLVWVVRENGVGAP